MNEVTLNHWTIFAVGIASVVFTLHRLLSYLRFLQQEEYSACGFLAWVWRRQAFDRQASLMAVTALGFSMLCDAEYPAPLVVLSLLLSLVLAVTGLFQEDPCASGKITLKMTDRAKRIYRFSFFLYLFAQMLGGWLAIGFFSAPIFAFWLWQLCLFQLMPIFLSLAVILLSPGEKIIQNKFRIQAEELLSRCHPFIVAITGSYGKTSSKDILAKFLNQALGPTFWPKGGINTVMGITREIREKLGANHRYAVIEMGAYREGSIRRLCQFTPPKAAIVTAVGVMHLERFGSAENIYRAKSEIAQALPKDGILVCNGDNPGARRMASEYPSGVTLLYGLEPERGRLDSWISDIEVKVPGTFFKLHWQGVELIAKVPLHGRPALSNVLAAFTMACALGADPEYLIAAMANLQPVSNRLEVRLMGDFVQINDAYNSNPVGFAAALEVLKELPGKRKILVTPGMIELGKEQQSENAKAAELAAGVCDLVMLVGKENLTALKQGLERGGFASEKIRLFNSRDNALHALAQDRREGDVVLLENDLPDLFEMELRF